MLKGAIIGLGIYAANAAASIADGVEMAGAAIDSGRAMECVERLVALTRELAREAQPVAASA